MKIEHLTVVIVALATVAYPGKATSSPLENRYVKAGNRAKEGATDFHREHPAGAMRKIPNNGDMQDRVKRAYAPWSGEHSEYQTYTTFSVWKPPVYQLSRPYYIPVYGSPGRIPIYFAPQPFDYDPLSKFPPNNKPPFVGPPYLPPITPTTEMPGKTTMTVENRFDFDDEDDDRPVWDNNNINGNKDRQPSNVPTRPPPPPQGIPDFPPLVHDVTNTGAIHLSAQDEELINEVFTQNNIRTTAPPPRTQAPPRYPRPTTPRTATQFRPPQPPTQGPSGPSNCVWAVVSCCSAATNVYPEKCFEQRGCPGPFWGSSPCDTEFAKAAVDAALNYYNQR